MNLEIIRQYLVPQHLLSRMMGKLAGLRISWLKNAVIKWFIKRYGVDMSQAQEPDYRQYPNFKDFFTRALKTGARPLVTEPHSILSPVDGAVSQLGVITQNKIFQAKGFDYSLNALLGGDDNAAKQFADGAFATLYLAPKDYHRIHMPLAGKLTKMTYVPGKLFSVNQTTAEHITDLFARNERVICTFDTEVGNMAVILVGAMIVASIETVWAGLIAPRRPRQITHWEYQDENITLACGDELGRFNLGSTVILLFEKQRITWTPSLSAESDVIMGQTIASIRT